MGTKYYKCQSGTEMMVQPGLANRTFGAPMGAHGTAAVGEDGILYGLFDQCPISGPETRYQRPQISAGPRVIRWWEWYWTDPNASNNRCFAIPPGRDLPEFPPASQPPCPRPHAGCRPFTVASGTFAPTVYEKDDPPPPVPEPHQFAAWIERAAKEGFMVGTGPRTFNPDGFVTRGQMAVIALKLAHGSFYTPPPCEGMFDDVECGP